MLEEVVKDFSLLVVGGLSGWGNNSEKISQQLFQLFLSTVGMTSQR